MVGKFWIRIAGNLYDPTASENCGTAKECAWDAYYDRFVTNNIST